jgi:hypothetical protein
VTQRKRIEIDGKFYRKRRGKLVEIPSEWVGETLHPQTKRKRASKGTRKDAMRVDGVRRERSHSGGIRSTGPGHPRNQTPRHSSDARKLDDHPEDVVDYEP